MSLTQSPEAPWVSVVIPTHNRDRYLPQTLESVLAQQEQGVQAEVIVVDDCSTDQTPSVLAGYAGRIQSLRLDANSGAGAARNAGLKRASGKYVKFLDSDDVLCPGILQKELQLAEQAAADMVICGWGLVEIDERLMPIPGTERISGPPDMTPVADTVLMGRAAPTSAVLYRRQYLDGLWWEPRIRCPDDWHFFCQAALKNGRIATLPSQAYWLRNHPGPRASVAGMLTYARGHHAVLSLIETTLASQNLLTPERKQRLAQYYYKQIYVLALYDRKAFDQAAAHIRELDPGFQPVAHERKWYMRTIARWLGFRRAVLLYTAAKRRLRAGSMAPSTPPAEDSPAQFTIGRNPPASSS